MAGHSKWAKIHRGKAIEDAKRGAKFTKLGNAIAIAARSGDDPDLNFALRLAIDKAKQANMPASNIQKAIDRGSGKLGGEQIQEVMYEGYGPGGAAILVECATDNINRTYPAVRLAFTKHGGNIAEKGAVAFQFSRKGVIIIKGTGEEQLLTILDSGAEDAVEEDGETIVYTDPKKLAEIRDKLKDAGLEVQEAELSYEPDNLVKIEDKPTTGKITRLMDALDEIDEVSKTYVNFDIPEEITGG
ncbi:MAG TPA: YebC/PmpR family DNA-binding transcriptional regulator [Candidatus Saccharimonadales bacterium]|nr:YebC/PmpR family DNA-binding transcriptional regulator [Candidatus Saccharimonadales bacterium]